MVSSRPFIALGLGSLTVLLSSLMSQAGFWASVPMIIGTVVSVLLLFLTDSIAILSNLLLIIYILGWGSYTLFAL